MRSASNGMKSKTALVINIGTSEIEGALFLTRPDQPPEIKKILSVKTPLVPDKDFHFLWRHTRKSLPELLRSIKRDSPDKINIVSFIFSSPWYLSQTRIAKLNRASSFKISEKLVKRVVDDEIARFKNEIKVNLLKSDDDIVFTEQNIMKSLLNGYEVSEFVNKEVKEAEFYIYASAVMKSVYDEVLSFVHHEIGRVEYEVSSFPFAAFDICRRLFNSEDGFLFVEIGGEITDISMIRNGILETIASLPHGAHSITRKVAGMIGFPLEETHILLERHARKELTDSAHEKIAEFLPEAVQGWYNFFEEAAENFANAAPLPRNIFLTGEFSGLKEIKEMLGGGKTANFTFLGKPFAVQELSSAAFDNRFHFKDNIKTYHSVSLIISTLFIDNNVWQKK